MVLIRLSAIVLLALSSLVPAAPTTTQVDDFPNMLVLIRDSREGGFAASPAMADRIKSEIRSGHRRVESTNAATEERSIASFSPDIASREALAVLQKRAKISLEYCADSQCTLNCLPTISTFTSNFCLNTAGTQCIIIREMTFAKIKYWNKAGCNGNESTYRGCGATGNLIAPGTNSIGFQVDC